MIRDCIAPGKEIRIKTRIELLMTGNILIMRKKRNELQYKIKNINMI